MKSKTTYNSKIHHRRSIRLKGYDYAEAGFYFITLNCQNRQRLFGEVINGVMYLNHLGLIAYREWLNTEEVRKNCTVHDFIIMPDHIHGIIEIRYKIHTSSNRLEDVGTFQSPSHAVGSIVRGIKISIIKKVKLHFTSLDLNEKDRFDFVCMHPDPFSKNTSREESQFIRRDESQFMRRDGFQITPTDKLHQNIKDLKYKIWQRDYYERIIRTRKEYRRVCRYILQNPMKWIG